MMEESKVEDPIAELIINYHELNSSVIEELDEEPSALEFMRFVARNTPFVVRGAARNWQATRTWTVDYLKDFLGDEPVNVAVTPAGYVSSPQPSPSPSSRTTSTPSQLTHPSNADAPTPYTSPLYGTTTLVFAKPHEEDQPFSSFLDYLTTQELTPTAGPNSSPSEHEPPQEIRYAQTQNDNLRAEYRALFSAVPPSIPWARIALARDPDAINLWIGNSHSVTALHKDNYENVYVQAAGRKHFVLLPPVCHAAVGERLLRPAVYARTSEKPVVIVAGGEEQKEEKGDGGLELMLEEDGAAEAVPFATWDPDRPAENATPYSALVQPMRVTLEPGDMLYLPCMWWVDLTKYLATVRG
jgi:jumonji domain-containing protein 7